MNSTRKTVVDAIQLAMAEPLHLPLSSGVPIYEYNGLSARSHSRWTITIGTTPGWPTAETCHVLETKVKKAWPVDQESELEFSGLAGKTLSNSMDASSERMDNSLDDLHFAVGLRTCYVLILSDHRGPIGFCAFAVNLESFAHQELVDFEIEVLEVFIEPEHREGGHSHGFCVVIAQFAINALGEFNDRLFTAGVRFAEGIILKIVGDVESRSGARFLFSIEKEFERLADESRFDDWSPFRLGEGFSIESIEVDPRW